MSKQSFVKYSGNGNDFVIFNGEVKLTRQQVISLCHRHFGIGADGIIVLSKSLKADARMRIFNAADGTEAEMCGNGLRCLATYFDEIAPIKKDSYLIETMNAIYPVFRKNQSFALEMSEIKDQNIHDLSIFKEYERGFYINTGVPHLVFLCQEVDKVDVYKEGQYYRFHPLFPQGTNVTFVQVMDKNLAKARTYERGVEQETYSCGTGLTATAHALKNWYGWSGDVHFQTRGGQQLVSLNEKIYYSGEVIRCFHGEVEL